MGSDQKVICSYPVLGMVTVGKDMGTGGTSTSQNLTWVLMSKCDVQCCSHPHIQTEKRWTKGFFLEIKERSSSPGCDLNLGSQMPPYLVSPPKSHERSRLNLFNKRMADRNTSGA